MQGKMDLGKLELANPHLTKPVPLSQTEEGEKMSEMETNKKKARRRKANQQHLNWGSRP
jgi:hypothetical protein